MGDESRQLEYVVIAIKAIVLILFPMCPGSRPDPAWQLLCPSVLTLLVCPCCHGLCEALDCVLSTLPLPEGPSARLQDEALALDPSSKHTVAAALLGQDGWNDIPLQVPAWVWMSRDHAKTLSHFITCIALQITISFTPAAPGVFNPLQHDHSWAPCIAEHWGPLTPAQPCSLG